MNEQFTLESTLPESRSIINAFDPSSGAPRIDLNGPFWKAVDRAHELGFRGDGNKVAIVDTACDLNIPFLQRRVDYVWPDSKVPAGETRATDHGTAVALLITYIAPEARLQTYPVWAQQPPPGKRVREAVEAATNSDASVINLSLGIEREFQRHENIENNPGLDALMNDPHHWLDIVSPDVDPCKICATASVAAQQKLVFAAAGNDPATITCPARASGVVAIGFQRSVRTVITHADGHPMENATATGTGEQSPAWDIALDEFNGILGTSFASPLYAGVGALGIASSDLKSYLTSLRWGALAQIFHGLLRAGQRSDQMVSDTRDLYLRSLQSLPHVHCSVNAALRPDLEYTDPKTCWSCGVFAQDKFTNAGLFFAEMQETDGAASLLVAATEFAPWSYDAFANLGATYRKEKHFDEAASCYERALELRPGCATYIEALDGVQRELNAHR